MQDEAEHLQNEVRVCEPLDTTGTQPGSPTVRSLPTIPSIAERGANRLLCATRRPHQDRSLWRSQAATKRSGKASYRPCRHHHPKHDHRRRGRAQEVPPFEDCQSGFKPRQNFLSADNGPSYRSSFFPSCNLEARTRKTRPKNAPGIKGQLEGLLWSYENGDPSCKASVGLYEKNAGRVLCRGQGMNRDETRMVSSSRSHCR